MELDKMTQLKDLKYQLTITPILTPIVEEEKKEIQKIPFNLRGNIKVIHKSEKDRIIAGYANIAVVDLEDQFIPIETLKKGINSLLNDPHYSNLMLVHQNIQIGKIIPKYNELTTHVDDKGLFIVAEIRKDIKTADKVWEAILDGEINGFSIGCEVIQDHQTCDEEKCITVLDEINIFEVSICSNPISEQSGFVVVSKSHLDDYVCNECIENIDKMTKTKKKTEIENIKKKDIEEPVEETKQVPPEDEVIPPEEDEEEEEEEEEMNKSTEKTVDERIADLERSVSSMTEIIQSLANPTEEKTEEETPPVEEPSEEKGAPWGSMDPSNQSSKPAPSPDSLEPPQFYKSEDKPKEEEKSPESPYPDSTYFDELKKSIDKLTKSVTSLLDKEELKLSIKARDDQINALKEKLKTLDKSESKPKTIQDDSKSIELERDPKFVVKRGEVYRKN